MDKNIKAVSFSIYGSNPKYTEGLLQNIPLAQIFYPEWKIFIYFDETVPDNILKKLKIHENVILKDMTHTNIPGMFWRFLINDENNIKLFIIRDADSRISLRESIVVHEWIKSNKNLHIMRDHPHHNFKILGGMWGMRVKSHFSMKTLISNYLKSKNTKFSVDSRGIDQDFLKDVVYKMNFFSKMVHAEFHRFEFFANHFPVERINQHFVGEIFDENNLRTDHYKLL
jgi:hypothetical protein